MPSKRKRDVLFHIENEVQFESLKPLLVHIRDKTRIAFDVVVPDAKSAENKVNKKMFDSAVSIIEKSGFKVLRSEDGYKLPKYITSTEYKLFLSAYMYRWHYQNINAKYRVMFPYAAYYFNKPKWTIDHFITDDYLADGLISHAIGTKPVTDIFVKTYIAPSLKLMDYKKKKRTSKKPTLFFAPTYNEIEFATNLLDTVDELKKKYKLIMRGHHRVDFLEDKKDISNQLYSKADKIYDMKKYSLIPPLQEADIVLTDNSAVMFDAMYCGVPVVLFSKDPNSFQYREINTVQSNFIKNKDVLWTDNSKELPKIVDKTLTATMKDKQIQLQKTLFPGSRAKPVEQWMDILNVYLNEELPEDYHLTKKYWNEKVLNQTIMCEDAGPVIKHLEHQLNEAKDRLYHEQNLGVKRSFKKLVKACIKRVG